MQCPFCGNALVAERHAGIEIHRCSGCESLWFDRGELDAFLSARANAGGDLEASAPELRSDDASPLTCPRCSVASLEASELDGLRLRRCMQCRGIALERADAARIAGPQHDVARDAAGEALLATDGSDLGSIVEAVLDILSGLGDL